MKKNLAMELWQRKQPSAERKEYEVYWDMNKGYEQKEKNTSSLVTESQ